jgi:PAS domain S-box-containing protein
VLRGAGMALAMLLSDLDLSCPSKRGTFACATRKRPLRTSVSARDGVTQPSEQPRPVPRANDRPSEEQFRLLVESVRDYAIFMLAPDGRVATWNAGAQAIKGYTAEEIVGTHFSRFYEPEAVARGWPEHELALATAHGRFEDEGWRLRKDGTRFLASVVITALRGAKGELRGFAKVTRDLTARRRLEDLQKTERRMNEFLAMLAHELRNPLAPMRTALDIARRSKGEPSIPATTLDIFGRQLDRLTRMVDDLLDVGRVTTGKVELRLEELDLNRMLRECVAALRPAFEARNQTLKLSLPNAPTPVRGDAARIAQVISNLLTNANKFTHDRGDVAVDLQHAKHYALLQVTDNGIGIETPMLPIVFNAFVQSERSLDRPGGGLGLGLTLVKSLVDLHGGSVAAMSAGLGRGSTFSITLPMLAAAHAWPAEDAAQEPVGGEALRVLVVDDNQDITQSLAMLLALMGHDVETATDGAHALDAAKSFNPDVVLLDIGLPKMNGYDVARGLRAMPAMRDCLIVACTGYGSAEDRQKALAAGFDRHAVKPVTADTLTTILVEAVGRIRGDRTPAS